MNCSLRPALCSAPTDIYQLLLSFYFSYLCLKIKNMPNDWKDRLGIVYSTNPGFKYDKGADKQDEILVPGEQNLRVTIDRKRRKGKTVTLVTGFTGSAEELKKLGKLLKIQCGAGGTAKDGEILIQGDLCNKITEILKKEGYRVR